MYMSASFNRILTALLMYTISILPSIYFREERPQKYMAHLEKT